ncbi:hypothetical protein [uncultured Roseibium sp.]|uniref:hypothetical protein n=1 Tax=uncultured Roseibium sp. TaxID=1936171 RepID=UPI0026333025|nr:hypothetical protein [uncultured Roseibium sp.]
MDHHDSGRDVNEKTVTETVAAMARYEGDEQLLMEVFKDAIEQCLNGKGDERHGHGNSLENQPIYTIVRGMGSDVGKGGLIFQASKKMMEAAQMPPDRAYKEIMGALIYANVAAQFAKRGEW